MEVAVETWRGEEMGREREGGKYVTHASPVVLLETARKGDPPQYFLIAVGFVRINCDRRADSLWGRRKEHMPICVLFS